MDYIKKNVEFTLKFLVNHDLIDILNKIGFLSHHLIDF